MQKYGYCPLETLVQYAQADNTPADTKLKIAETLLPYMYPKLSNVTLEGEVSVSERAESQAALLRKVLADPELADAAQKLSIAASMAMLESEASETPIQ